MRIFIITETKVRAISASPKASNQRTKLFIFRDFPYSVAKGKSLILACVGELRFVCI